MNLQDAGPKTYRGISIPATLRPNVLDNRIEVTWWKAGVDSTLDNRYLDNVGLNVRIQNVLYRHGYNTLDSIAENLCVHDMHDFKKVGYATLDQVEAALHDYKLDWKKCDHE